MPVMVRRIESGKACALQPLRKGVMKRMEHLGDLEQLVMLAVLRLGEAAYGASIQRELATRARRKVSLGTVHVTLMRLENKGLVRSWLGDPSPNRGGKARRHYSLERGGEKALRATRDTMARMWDGLSTVGGASPSESHAK
jgi:PadR family transcriptional regulator